MWVHNIHVWVSEYERDLRDLVDFDPFPSALKQYDLGQNKVFKFVLLICHLGEPISTWTRKWQPTPVHLPEESHGQKGLVGYSPCGHEESDMTEWLHFHSSLLCTGEGNGKPLQCSCLENPRDRGSWWAAVYGVTQSRARLKWLSSSNLNWQVYW